MYFKRIREERQCLLQTYTGFSKGSSFVPIVLLIAVNNKCLRPFLFEIVQIETTKEIHHPTAARVGKLNIRKIIINYVNGCRLEVDDHVEKNK